MAWMQNMYKKFEAMCLELDDILEQEGVKYADHLQIVGANVKQFCSDIVRDVKPQPSEDTVDGVASVSCLVKNTESDKMSKEGIVQNHFDMEPCNVSRLLYSCSVEPIKATKNDLSLEEMVVAEIYEKSVSSLKENQSNSLTEVIPIDGLSSKSVNLVDSYESKVPELGFTSSEASAESIRQIDNSTEDSTNLGSSSSTKLDGSCFVTDCNELSSVSYEAGQLGSSKETLDNVSCRWEKPLVVALKHSEGIKHKVLFQEQEAYNNTKALIHALSIYI
ncbi:hypothetical protein NC653_010673 [Populus alba x Populus x berolinensis]|uniref:Uncharacterized protein n=1 Tax=Populus alba x Populus x berolinensis TaxID=444605 RepID=A0AAD6R090_9ROSI|nr:hypothetical protein NC653_010667 [Populus alba x Populus x berolinensis]KAJ6999986.1 hypothetical protein NC653_010673 [Populus alba x Populus x berolinensis]